MSSWRSRLLAAFTCTAVLSACNLGDPLDGKRPMPNNTTADAGSDARTELCGNGTVDPGEACDGDCPASCDDGDACTADTLVGSDDTCDAVCSNTVIEGCSNLCGNGTVDLGETCDGDCPTCDDGDICTEDAMTGDPSTCDVTCSNAEIPNCVDPSDCGNQVVDPGETCDGNCPACDDGDVCTMDVTTGSAATCDVVCTSTPIPNCVDPADCGNGVLDPGETCDGNCPNCDDQDACTTDVTTGSAATCNAACSNTPVTACVNADGCCPSGCVYANDNDCPCIPRTCMGAGYECGTLDDGCGQMLTCGPCGATESCYGTVCMPSQGVGDACANSASCPLSPDGSCIEEATQGWPGGYCSDECAMDADCPIGTTCQDGSCLLSCTTDAECRSPYRCLDRDSDGSTECVPVGTGTRAVGEQCALVGDCAGGVDALCQTAQPDGRWAGGYCMLRCTTDAACPVGSHCVTATGTCADACATDVECRTGHRCVDADADGRRECWGKLDRPIGAGCEVAEQCEIWNPPAPTGCLDATFSEWPGGYCTANCPNGDADCPAGAHCSEGICKESCTSSSQCRGPQYQCYDRDGDTRLECEPVGNGFGAVSAPCSVRSDCSGGQAALCVKEDAAGRWDSGYCSLKCTVDANCPVGTHCWASQVCLNDCTTNTDCRSPGYACMDGDGDARKECFGALLRSVGDPCEVGNDCGLIGPQVPQCIPESSGYPGGYCIAACAGDAECPAGTDCFASSHCEVSCQSAADCRQGYRCYDADADGDAECHP